MNGGPSVAIVVPALNEAGRIADCLTRLRTDFPDCELVLVDGGSGDDTVRLAEPHARVVHSPVGRGHQLNAGAAATTAEVLWFIHADTILDPDALRQLRSVMADPAVIGGGFSLRFDHRTRALDLLARSSNLRARRLHLIFGDQAMFVRRSVFDRLGGFPQLPIMEDFELSRRLHRTGRLVVLAATSTASARRFQEHGTWRTIVLMQWLKLLYVAGCSPERIRDRYERGPKPFVFRRFRARGSHAGAAH